MEREGVVVMDPQHHLPADVLMEYAAGTAAATTSLLVACHITLCALCRAEVQRLEEVGARLLEQQPEASLPTDALARLLARVDSERVEPLTAAAPNVDARLPRPLQEVLPGGRFKLARWLPGMKGITLRLAEAPLPPARLVLFGPNVCIPSHDHEAPEYLLVLDGEVVDNDKVYRRGDVSVSETGHVHEQRISQRGPCLCLIVNEGGIRPKTLWGQLLKRIAGL